MNVLPIVGRTRRITSPFHKKIYLTLSLGAGKITSFLTCVVSISRVREELFLKARELFPNVCLRCVVWEICPSSFKMPFFYSRVDFSAILGPCLPKKIFTEKSPHVSVCAISDFVENDFLKEPLRPFITLVRCGGTRNWCAIGRCNIRRSRGSLDEVEDGLPDIKFGRFDVNQMQERKKLLGATILRKLLCDILQLSAYIAVAALNGDFRRNFMAHQSA